MQAHIPWICDLRSDPIISTLISTHILIHSISRLPASCSLCNGSCFPRGWAARAWSWTLTARAEVNTSGNTLPFHHLPPWSVQGRCVCDRNKGILSESHNSSGSFEFICRDVPRMLDKILYRPACFVTFCGKIPPEILHKYWDALFTLIMQATVGWAIDQYGYGLYADANTTEWGSIKIVLNTLAICLWQIQAGGTLPACISNIAGV